LRRPSDTAAGRRDIDPARLIGQPIAATASTAIRQGFEGEAPGGADLTLA
jgi:hypothetical protein